MIKLKTNNWTMDNIETVIFDKDGTFIDLHFFWGKITEMRVNKILEEFNLSNDYFNQLCLFLGYDFVEKKMIPEGITALYSRAKIIKIFNNNLKTLGVYTDEINIEKLFDLVSVEFNKNIGNYIKLIDEAIDFIKNLYQKGVKLGVVTSDSVVTTNLTLKKYNLEKYFEVIIGRESSVEIKESGIPTKMALEFLNAKPDSTVMIGDAPMDYISAKKAGIDNVILVASGQIDKLTLQKTTPYVVESLKDVECILT